MVEQVEQVDIDAAQAIYDTIPLYAVGQVKARAGHDLVQAFAAHRLAALQPAQGEGELLPCPNPWCSSHEHGPEGVPKLPDDLWELSGSNRVRIGCAYCPMKGPPALTEAEAIAAWNRRAPLPALREKDARIAALEQGADLLGMLLGADPGPKYAAAAKEAREWWLAYDRAALEASHE